LTSPCGAGTFPATSETAMPTVGRNDPCPCSSGKKYKRCCLAADEKARATKLDLPTDARLVERDGQTLLASNGVTDRELADAAAYFDQKARGRGPAQQVADFAKPLLDAAKGDFEAMQRAYSLGAVLWNVALCDDEKTRDELLDEVIGVTHPSDEDAREFRALALEMIERHKTMFPDLHRR
jgi:hypothetical protein